MVAHIKQDVIHFAFMLLIAFENFTLGGLLLFGSEVQTWSSVLPLARAAPVRCLRRPFVSLDAGLLDRTGGRSALVVGTSYTCPSSL